MALSMIEQEKRQVCLNLLRKYYKGNNKPEFSILGNEILNKEEDIKKIFVI